MSIFRRKIVSRLSLFISLLARHHQIFFLLILTREDISLRASAVPLNDLEVNLLKSYFEGQEIVYHY